jgi:hypothetical protein
MITFLIHKNKEDKMDKALLKKHIRSFVARSKSDPAKFSQDINERLEYVSYYQGYTADKLLKINEDQLYEYISKLWAMRIWGNKHYVVEKAIEVNGLNNFKEHLAKLIWGKEDVSARWDTFRKEIKGLGPAMISEILCKAHPDEFMLWNRRAYVGLHYLKAQGLPRYDYQLTGEVYKNLCAICREISKELKAEGMTDTTMLAVDYFIWDELQVEDNLSKIYAKGENKIKPVDKIPSAQAEFIHDDIRDKVRDIGQWLGFNAKIEQKVSEGSKVDAIWEATIGNMGRVIYIFEVQTKGSIDSLVINLLKSLNNQAVQGVVAVSDKKQLEQIKRHAMDVKDLRDKLKYWDYEEISRIHESLEYVNSCINNLGLVPEGF